MSVVAKILIVVNLLLAVVFLGAAATFLGTKESYKAQLEKSTAELRQEIETITAQRDAERTKVQSQAAEINSLNTAKAQAETTLSTREEDYQRVVKDYQEQQGRYERLSQTMRDMEQGSQQKDAQIASLNDQIEQERGEKRTAVEEQNNAVTEQRRLEAELQTAQDNIAELEKRVNDQSGEIDTQLVMLKAYEDKFGALAEGINMKALEAQVQAVDNEMNIVILSIGRDDEVKPGYTFTVYRDGEYVGKVVVDNVERDHASGYSQKELEAKPIQVGDSARTRW